MLRTQIKWPSHNICIGTVHIFGVTSPLERVVLFNNLATGPDTTCLRQSSKIIPITPNQFRLYSTAPPLKTSVILSVSVRDHYYPTVTTIADVRHKTFSPHAA